MLQHGMHSFHIFGSITPVPLGIHVAQFQAIQLTQFDLGYCINDLPRNELQATKGGFMVEEDTAGRKHIIGFTVVNTHPVSIELGYSIGAARIERGSLILRNLLNLTKHFGCGCLIETNFWINNPNCL